MTQLQTVLTSVSIINAIAFLLFWCDKKRAIVGKSRVSEIRLLWITFFGGTIGSALAMILFRHKTAKTSFLMKFFGVVLLQVFAICFLINK